MEKNKKTNKKTPANVDDKVKENKKPITEKKKKFVVHGHTMYMVKDTLFIKNENNIPISKFKKQVESLVTYMMDELIITTDFVDIEIT